MCKRSHYAAPRIRWLARPDGLEESVQFCPGYNCADQSMRGHGVHGMEILWLLRGPAGAVQAIFQTDWIPGQLWPGHGLSPHGSRSYLRLNTGLWSSDPSGLGIGRHTRFPQYDGHEPRPCGLLDGNCYYDEQISGADPLVVPFMAKGEQPIWTALEQIYAEFMTGGSQHEKLHR